MPAAEFRIELCPPPLRGPALALALGELAPSLRSEIGTDALSENPAIASRASSALYIALQEEQLFGATWGQLQPGRTAVFWPPRFDSPEPRKLPRQELSRAALAALDKLGVEMTQVLLPSRAAPEAAELQSLGFGYLADLEYLTCERPQFPVDCVESAELAFIPYDDSQRQRLRELVEATYKGTLDCAVLGEQRQMDDVIAGYRATGEFRPENWLFVQWKPAQGKTEDAGVLLLAIHPAARHTELVYMGLAPWARGRGWGRQIVRQAQRLAAKAHSERIVLAVDAVNSPAKGVYQATGFQLWDRRSVFLRFRDGRPPAAVSSPENRRGGHRARG